MNRNEHTDVAAPDPSYFVRVLLPAALTLLVVEGLCVLLGLGTNVYISLGYLLVMGIPSATAAFVVGIECSRNRNDKIWRVIQTGQFKKWAHYVMDDEDLIEGSILYLLDGDAIDLKRPYYVYFPKGQKIRVLKNKNGRYRIEIQKPYLCR